MNLSLKLVDEKTMEQPAATLWDFPRLKGAFQIRVL